MIWSSFLTESLLGPPCARSRSELGLGGAVISSVLVSVSDVGLGEPMVGLVGSLWLFVLVGFVCGEDAGEKAR